MATKGGNKGLDFLQGKARISVPKKKAAGAAPATGQPQRSAPTVATQVVKTTNYGITVSGKTFNVQVTG
jgi:pyruvate carboxylase subunit B